jgi:hypothetical protein
MEKTVSQLHAAVAVDEKYASIDPFIKKLEAQVAIANASDKQKQDFLGGVKSGMGRSLEPRNELLRTEETWMKSTIDLYDFAIAHSSQYSIKGGKVYFRDDATREGFVSQQSKAVALHKDFLKAKEAFEQSRKNKMDQLGVSSSDLTPEQLGKTR